MVSMQLYRRLLPLLAAVLVIQGLVSVLPHQHRSVPVDGPALQLPSSNGAVHDCFACSIHAPAVDLSVEFRVATGLAAAPLVAFDRRSSVTFSVLSPSSPRGPPRFV
jgi:hypothetical protein